MENVTEKLVFSITFPGLKIQYFLSCNYIGKDSLFRCLFGDLFRDEKGATGEVYAYRCETPFSLPSQPKAEHDVLHCTTLLILTLTSQSISILMTTLDILMRPTNVRIT